MPTNSESKKIGGAAIAAGGFGCVFYPALRCSTERGHNKETLYVDADESYVSKVLEKRDAREEFDAGKKIYLALKDVPNSRNYFVFPTSLCIPAPAEQDEVKNVQSVCQNKRNIGYVNSYGKWIWDKNARIIEIPYAGTEVKQVFDNFAEGSRNNIDAFRAYCIFLIADLIKNAIMPMIKRGIIHNDIKSENMMIDHKNRLRIIDWGLSGFLNKGRLSDDHFLRDRPFQFNVPFGGILIGNKFNKFLKEKCSQIAETSLGKDEVSKTLAIPLQITSFLSMLGVKDINHYSLPGHFGYTESRIASTILTCSKTGYTNPFIDHSDQTLTSSLTMRYIVTDNLITIARAFSKATPEGHIVFDEESYARNVYLNNADIWGALSALLPFARIIGGGSHSQKASGMLRGLMTKYMYSSQYAAKAIPSDQLISDLRDVAIMMLQVNGVENVKAFAKAIRHPNGEGIREKNFLYFLKHGKIEPAKFNNTSGRTPISKSTGKKKTKVHSTRTTRERCPKGTRRNKKTGKCEPRSR